MNRITITPARLLSAGVSGRQRGHTRQRGVGGGASAGTHDSRLRTRQRGTRQRGHTWSAVRCGGVWGGGDTPFLVPFSGMSCELWGHTKFSGDAAFLTHPFSSVQRVASATSVSEPWNRAGAHRQRGHGILILRRFRRTHQIQYSGARWGHTTSSSLLPVPFSGLRCGLPPPMLARRTAVACVPPR